MNNERTVKPVTRIENVRSMAMPTRESGWAVLPADRSFKVLQPSRAPSQLSLFPPPGQAFRTARPGR
jgi:hypothetical protein